ncbi:ataxin-2-like protein isoform X3 [Limulus polyphemus]|nr:ataxin-2-like protein isoform X3 [Limulus polyphemus]XP_022254089.1 ataxin-2-like protein isoform X3 [Limulus polyphemus]
MRKNRSNTTSKPTRHKGPQEKGVAVYVEGVYSNARFMHGAASLVGCIVQVQVKNGNLIEGIFKTFSPKMELVLEMPHRVHKNSTSIAPLQGLGENLNSFITNYSAQDSTTEKLIFSLEDVVMVKAVNVDLDYATRGFTDSSISKFNGEIFERELEPWEGHSDGYDETISLDSDRKEAKNGWDPNEMFRKNAEKFGVTSTYDSTLQGYTVPLEPKNTEEYKKQEAKAVKIAQEIENSQQYLSRIAVENGDEEEKYSAVIRPLESTQTSSNQYILPQRRRSGPGNKQVRNVIPPSSLYSSKISQHTVSPAYSQCHKSTASMSSPISNSVTTSSPIYVSSKPPLPPQASVTPTQRQPLNPCQPQNTANYQESKEKRVNGVSVPFECKIEDPKLTSVTESKENISCVMQVTSCEVVTQEPVTTVAKPNQRIKGGNQKGRNEQLAEFKRFSSDFRLMEEPKEQREQHKDFMQPKTESVAALQESKNINKDTNEKGSEKRIEMGKNIPVADIGTPTAPDSAAEKLYFNPNEREFTLNPNAKSFTPRTSLSASTSPAPVVMQQHRMHTQSPVVALPQQPMVLGMGQPTFTTMQPQYVMSSPGNVSLAPQFPQTVGVSQGQRFKKPHQIAMQQRHDMMPCVHVAAATGQPILAPATIPTPPQLAMSYPSQAVVQAGGPQPGMPYAQVYPVLSRMMSPQPVGMVPTSPTVSYGEYVQVAGHIYMSPQMGVPVSGVQNFIHQASSGPHSAPSTPQSQTPGTSFHASSSIHQLPTAPYVTSVQTPTPAGQPGHAHTPQPVVYSQMMPQPSMLHPGPQSLNTSQAHHLNQNHSHPHHISFSGAPQSMILMPHGHYSVASGHHAFQGHPSHGHSPGNYTGTPTNVIPHMPMTIIPTSCAMGPNPMVNAPFIAHPQGTSQGQPNPVQPYPQSH